MKPFFILAATLVVIGALLADFYIAMHASSHAQTVDVTLAVPPTPKPRPAVVMRDARIICLSAILHKTPPKNWELIKDQMAHSPNVCLIAEFLYPGTVPEKLPANVTEQATKAIDHG